MSPRFRLLDKVAECERRVSLSADPQEKSKSKMLHDIWMALVNESASMPSRQLASEIAAIEEIQSALDSGNGIEKKSQPDRR